MMMPVRYIVSKKEHNNLSSNRTEDISGAKKKTGEGGELTSLNHFHQTTVPEGESTCAK
jgi:hypothetical protein